MQLTQHTDFGLRLLIVLARKDGPISLPAFSAQQGLSYHHVAKVAQALVQAGFAMSQRGRSGGIALALPAHQITVGDVVRKLERGLRLADCATCALREDCALSSVLAEALEAFLAVLDRYTLADVSREGVAAFAPWAAIPPAPTCAVTEPS
ncbi:RrF2 family transcriptional regulator [Novosphingobium taihuense]|uniref:Rrf2 family nitric oxide-sensitive transcriptional repressor n=1 Tax=Novosphingobium taihuense TaxID=260085 RepID=A0A7W7AD09_9SPHN|nr:Rrf2 family transcriptional regulator [Novosphingobium taihuense]MBB4614631.1 Rrf2 family nitric oxide-sensitive transcriptional repressor [Novosphingobium taihuense]TWH86127.1 BadM/Rrf2 family transcriptional regulator [Novosphingobium taihuense]